MTNRTTRRRWLRGCGALSVVGLAGCLSDDIGSSETDDGPEGESTDLEFPPGLSSDGIDDPAALFDAHRSLVTATSFTGEYAITVRRTDETTDESTTTAPDFFEVRSEPGAERLEKTTFEGPDGSDVDHALYIDGDRGATNTSNHVTERTAGELVEASLNPMESWVRIADGEYDGTETIGAESVHSVSITGLEEQHVPDDELDEEGSILVDEDGLIRRFRAAQSGVRNDTRVELEASFEFSGIGETTVAEPAWVDDLEETGEKRFEVEPGSTVDFAGETSAWVGREPSAIAGVENPTLVLEEGESYTIGWSSGDGLAHNIEIRDENDEVVDDYETEVTTDPGPDQFLDIIASEEMAKYVCNPHEPLMNGDIEVR
ncbi:plastocyanin/azurin family copper-binding protein [Natrinema versiforme]|uniref:Blue (type 1) copper domain-containing protein n=1 Tax=Natrinema versiforme TaxID=88724 RepID=A0A4P8WIL3_9EURY|nr:plastocyanin/azurin family copper-binding protein [Natrinema versiforme]QCS43297.1 hypothetical protein FEJ81_13380 [Natrinema versiforme]